MTKEFRKKNLIGTHSIYSNIPVDDRENFHVFDKPADHLNITNRHLKSQTKKLQKLINQFEKCAHQVEADLVEGRREHKRIHEANKMLKVKDGLEDFITVFASKERRKKENIRPKLLESAVVDQENKQKLISAFQSKQEQIQTKRKSNIQRQIVKSKTG